MAYEKVVAVYDTVASADAAVKTLKSAGYMDDNISVIKNDASSISAVQQPGFWHRLLGSDIEKHEADVFGHALKQGGVVLTARVPESDVPKVIALLDTHKPVDVIDRARSLGHQRSRRCRFDGHGGRRGGGSQSGGGCSSTPPPPSQARRMMKSFALRKSS